MDKKQQQRGLDTENASELLPRNPYCLNEGAHCGCKLPPVTIQPQWVTEKPCSLWKTFLVCLLACLIAMSLVVLVLYFVLFGKSINSSTNIIIHSDGKSNHFTCIPGSILFPPSPAPPGPQSTLLSPTPVTNQSYFLSTVETNKTTAHNHEVIIDDNP